MNKQEKIKLITKLVDQYKQLDLCFDLFYKLCGGDSDSKLGRAAWSVFDSYVDLAAAQIGDSPVGLSWFIWDNECGAKKLVCEVGGVKKKIKNVRDYVEFIELEK